MSTNNDISIIEQVKNENEGKSTSDKSIGEKLKDFLISILSIIIILVSYYIIGGFILYSCKIGQSNILPTEINCMPYGGNEPNIQPIQTNIFLNNTDPQLSEKLSFSYDKYNSKNTIIDILRKYKESPTSGKFINYFISILENFICFNYSTLNFYFNFINNMPETVVVLLGPILTIFYITFVFIFDHLYLIYLWFSQMFWLFKKNVSKPSDNQSKWTDITLVEPAEYGISILYVILFLFLFWVYFLGIPFISFILLSWSIFSILSFKGELNGKQVNVFDIVKDMFKHYKVTITGIISFFVVLSSFSNLGNIPGLFCLLTVILIYFGILSINIYKPINDENLSKLVSYEQARKTCKTKIDTYSNIFQKLNVPFLSGGGSKKLVHEINNLSKKLNKYK
jgi:hypothetical protein